VIFCPTHLPGAYLIEPERRHDERGFFARTWCRDEFQAQGLNIELAQCSVSFNLRRGTLRGLHYQRPPHAEHKLVRCTRGGLHDILLDLRADSSDFGRWQAFELSAENHSMLFIPPGVAHGFLTLSDDCEVFYQMSHCYDAPSAAGVRHDDPAFGIRLPEPVQVISDRDATYPDWQQSQRMQTIPAQPYFALPAQHQESSS
jgi:dTDP-4-dehydrorhamnose 3,5-epimerase